ncbi:MAG: exopolyphosphatase [gamma proteobacterium symbiont of Bathyaustriella thionipta]|nr:exopolyphosphatase [gamma proteobacterium symbiont of Bathyaustriella thionipta]
MIGYSLRNWKLPETVAAIDLGSNSFHMIVARIEDGHIQVIDKMREMVRLGAGLDDERNLTADVTARALACLLRFGQRVRDLPPGSVRAVGTNTLRQIKKPGLFLNAAEDSLGHPIEIIAGREEARLVYLGVAHGLEISDESRLVIDIGGGSTEMIIGRQFDTLLRESLHMGCVNTSKKHFPDGKITAERMKKAMLSCQLEIRPVRSEYQKLGWQLCVGSSGTIRSIRKITHEAGWCDAGITPDALKKLRKALIHAGHTDKIELAGLNNERKPVIAGGVAVLSAVFKSLDIQQMRVSDEALREGLIYDMIGRSKQQDARERTVEKLKSRFSIDAAQAQKVQNTATWLLDEGADCWGLDEQEYPDLLIWAAQLHELGLAVSHSQYHKHGAYLIAHADLSGFSRQEQKILAFLIRAHRRKIPLAELENVPESCREATLLMAVLLRLAVLLHRGHSELPLEAMDIKCTKKSIRLKFPQDWINSHPLTAMELQQEADRLQTIEFKLKFD